MTGGVGSATSRRWLSIYRASEQAFARRLAPVTAAAQQWPLTTLKISPFTRFRRLYSEAAASGKTAGAKQSSFPDISDKKVAYWLLGCSASVFGIVIFGGLTRLTESGLSITEWRPVTGSLPPLSQEDWEAEFAKYKDSPEYHILNPHMNLQEFKNIYYMEWIHRLWGRCIGLAFVFPAIYFVARRKVSKPMAWKIGGIAGLLGFQGVIGWWMVASGLKDDLFAPGSHPRVSQYRLTTHLGAAFVLYIAMLTSGLGILRAHKLFKMPKEGMELLKKLGDPKLKVLRRSVAGLAVLTFLTSMSGGLVAGLDAGLIYNDFPYMGAGLAPPKGELLDEHYCRKEDKSDLWWRNCFENPSLVQLNHRICALTTFAACCALFAYSKSPRMKKLLPRPVAMGVHGVLGFAALQASLGITTLIFLVPISLASLHQAGSLLLLTWTFVLGNRVWIPARTSRLLASAIKGQHVRLSGVSPLSARVQSAVSKAA
ncbi:Chromatin structure-remodeling complex protein rsc9 [Ascosphaera pollenicola]|nr:Chromatin structure-remodeling complex protein rsc9 [Ascosphaera pollenicola]